MIEAWDNYKEVILVGFFGLILAGMIIVLLDSLLPDRDDGKPRLWERSFGRERRGTASFIPASMFGCYFLAIALAIIVAAAVAVFFAIF